MKLLYITTLLLLWSCGQSESNAGKTGVAGPIPDENSHPAAAIAARANKTIRFLCRGNKYDAKVGDSVATIFIDEEYL